MLRLLVLLACVLWALGMFPCRSHKTQNDGFPTSVWGPCMWKLMHVMAANYPLEYDPVRAQGYYQFFESLKQTLPCKECRAGYTQFITAEGSPLKLRPELFANRETLFQWTVDLHDAVNAKLHKRVPTCQNWYPRYDRLRSGNFFLQ